MNRNPIVPFIMIMVLGIGLMFLLSFKGLGDSEEIAKEAEGGNAPKTEVAANPEDIYKQTCAGCHGNAYEGAMGPGLKGTGLSKEEIANILQNGTPGGMPPGLVKGEQLDAMADFIANLK